MIRPSRKLAALGFVFGALFGAQAGAEPPAGVGKAADAPGQAAKPQGAPGQKDKHEAKGKAETKTDKPGAKAEATDKADLAGKPADPSAPAAQGDKPGAKRAAFRSDIRELREEIKAGKVKKEEVQARLDKLRETRKDRQQAHRAALKERWGEKLANSAAISELRHHERRMAMLDRALLLAQTDATVKNKDKVIARVEKLIEKENERHERKMEQFQSAAAPGTAPGVVGASAPAQPAKPATVPAQAPAAPAGGEK